MHQFDNIKEIERCTDLSEAEFYNKYVKNSLPVVISNKAEWTKSNKFDPEYLKENYKHVTNTVNEQTYTFDEIIDICKASTPENKAPYPNIYNIEKDFPEYVNEIPETKYGRSNRLQSGLLPKAIAKRTSERQFLMGGEGCSFPILHFDYLGVHTQLTQIIGKKDFILYSPDQTPYFYADPVRRNHSPINVLEPDFDKYPLFKNAMPIKTTLSPGETLFIPSGWWHTTVIHDFNLTYAIDHVNEFNWDTFTNEIYLSTKNSNPKLAWMVKIYKLFMGKVFWLKERFA